MKYFFDTEFIENGSTIDLISLGVVSQDNRTLYLQNSECDFSKASDWVWRNVYSHLHHFDMRGKRACQSQEKVTDSGLQRTTLTKCWTTPENPCPWADRREMRDALVAFVNIPVNGKPEFWSYFAAYDWVALCQLFGTMMQLPKGFPMYCRDLKQLLDSKGNPRFQKDSDAHNSLSDALWIKKVYTEIES